MPSSTHLVLFVNQQLDRLFTEGNGSDAASLTTSAKRDGDHYILNGEKVSVFLSQRKYQASCIQIIKRTGVGLRTCQFEFDSSAIFSSKVLVKCRPTDSRHSIWSKLRCELLTFTGLYI